MGKCRSFTEPRQRRRRGSVELVNLSVVAAVLSTDRVLSGAHVSRNSYRCLIQRIRCSRDRPDPRSLSEYGRQRHCSLSALRDDEPRSVAWCNQVVETTVCRADRRRVACNQHALTISRRAPGSTDAPRMVAGPRVVSCYGVIIYTYRVRKRSRKGDFRC